MKGKLRLTALLAAIAMFTSTMTPVYADQLSMDLLYVRSYVPRIAIQPPPNSYWVTVGCADRTLPTAYPDLTNNYH